MLPPASRASLASPLCRLLLIIGLSAGLLCAAGEARASWGGDQVLRQAQQRYGLSAPAKARLQGWHALIQSSRRQSELEQLQTVNRYINRQIRFRDDRLLWQRKDYWATPLETLAKGAGDCEDFSLIKYFTLLRLGIPVQKLRITYARALALNQAHMVLTYSATPEAEPLVLDNLVDGILPAAAREDLLLLYGFDANGLYSLESGHLRRIGDTDRLPFWQRLLQKMRREGFNLAQLTAGKDQG